MPILGGVSVSKSLGSSVCASITLNRFYTILELLYFRDTVAGGFGGFLPAGIDHSNLRENHQLGRRCLKCWRDVLVGHL